MVLTEKQIEHNKKHIIRLLASTLRVGIDSVIDYLLASGFFIDLSSRKRHHCWKGGLAQHSLSVCTIALSNNNGLPRDSVILCAILHDICKANKLVYDDMGKLHHRETYIKGHGLRSIKLLDMLGLQINDDERRTIRWHMGGFHVTEDKRDDLQKARDSKLWKIIHKADVQDATYMFFPI